MYIALEIASAFCNAREVHRSHVQVPTRVRVFSMREILSLLERLKLMCAPCAF
jgi:hypothetical protein